ncbi:Uncharacterized protein APZ42_016072 [Daphnia magna]|uniref:Uncharacterized protein n=1 Tax=Daphnia magna TaxID=35525 RepID=A0A162NJS6_9CRUS|nr:Uncharacterized protein APZ42_016072 [Daphnia magna]
MSFIEFPEVTFFADFDKSEFSDDHENRLCFHVQLRVFGLFEKIKLSPVGRLITHVISYQTDSRVYGSADCKLKQISVHSFELDFFSRGKILNAC